MDQNYEHALTQMTKSIEKFGCSADQVAAMASAPTSNSWVKPKFYTPSSLGTSNSLLFNIRCSLQTQVLHLPKQSSTATTIYQTPAPIPNISTTLIIRKDEPQWNLIQRIAAMALDAVETALTAHELEHPLPKTADPRIHFYLTRPKCRAKRRRHRSSFARDAAALHGFEFLLANEAIHQYKLAARNLKTTYKPFQQTHSSTASKSAFTSLSKMARQVFVLALIFLVAGLVAADSSPSPAPKASFPKFAPSPKKSKSPAATSKALPVPVPKSSSPVPAPKSFVPKSSALKSFTPSASPPSDSSPPAESPTYEPSSPPAPSSEASSPTPTTSKSSPLDALGPTASDAPSADAPTSDDSGTVALKISSAIVAADATGFFFF
ncbi:hypothetical protein Fot_21052 [Forsythia ovata]|uniref:Uncharacterized protein n=1 Tax=Forsythia ovata TaxID=205694 RepID=A0ABD1UTQ9_9LAMI